MTCQRLPHSTQRIEAASLDPWRRFDEMAASVKLWAAKWSTTTLARWLHVEQLPLNEHEKALVALALKGNVAAGIVIDDYSPAGRGKVHQRFYEVVCIEWEQRHHTTGHRLAA
jgi:hypothetical protein